VINETKVPVAVHVAKITLHEFKRQQPWEFDWARNCHI